MKWFKHDSNASIDAKLKKLKHKYGMEGYGLYWYLLECIARTVEPHNLTFELEEDAELIAAEVNIHRDRVEEMMLFMCRQGLFENADGRITCLKMASRSDEYTLKLIRNGKGVRTISGATPDKVPPIRKEENRIEKKRTEEKETTVSALPQAEDAPAPAKRVNYQAIVDLYHQTLPNHPKIKVLTDARKRVIKQRCEKDITNLEKWESYFKAIDRSDFLSGRTEPRQGQRPFIADLEWICKPANFAKIVEGRYHGE